MRLGLTWSQAEAGRLKSINASTSAMATPT